MMNLDFEEDTSSSFNSFNTTISDGYWAWFIIGRFTTRSITTAIGHGFFQLDLGLQWFNGDQKT
jgi:hypothetical protein